MTEFPVQGKHRTGNLVSSMNGEESAQSGDPRIARQDSYRHCRQGPKCDSSACTLATSRCDPSHTGPETAKASVARTTDRARYEAATPRVHVTTGFGQHYVTSADVNADTSLSARSVVGLPATFAWATKLPDALLGDAFSFANISAGTVSTGESASARGKPRS